MPSLEEETESELSALVGTTVAGKYRVDRMIGRGGMGAVFQAANLAIGKRVALKFLNREAAQNREACQRFQREAEAAGMAESAHIVQIFDSGVTDNGLPFLVMELLTGEDLRARLRREGRLGVSAALRIVSQILRALLPAHEAGIVHRDLKPDNVFLCARDDDPSFVKIVDFGISKVARARAADTLTRRGTVLGTAFYMSPEQAQSFADIDGRTDLFSVGAILFEMLAGKPPHVAPTYEAVLIAICTHDAADVRTLAPEVPAAVAALVSRALEREREQRFQSAREFLTAVTALESALGQDGSAWATPSSSSRPTALPNRQRYRTWVLGIIASLAGFALTAYFVSRSGASNTVSQEPARPRAIAATSTVSSAALAPVVSPLSSRAVVAPSLPTRVPATASARRPPAAKPSAHVASGLKLNTKEP